MRRLMFAPALFGWLVLVWVLLWGTLDVKTVVFGVLVALGVLVLFPLPRVRSNIFARPVRLVGLALYVALDIVWSALRVAKDLFWYGRKVRSAVVAVPVLSDVDIVITSVANVISLAPGNFVLQIDRDRRLFYVYALGVRDPRQAAVVHNGVLDMQVRVISAIVPGAARAEVRAAAAAARKPVEVAG